MVPTANVLQRTFQLAFDGSSGTCFTVDHNDRQYIVTAKHLVQAITDSATIKIRHDDSWKDCQVNLVGHCDEPIDISVLTARLQISHTHTLVMTSATSLSARTCTSLASRTDWPPMWAK